MSALENPDPEAVGWKAIDAALAQIHGEKEPPFHFAAVPPYALGGEDPLQGISVYERDQPVPHWHFVTYGFSELYDKESDDLAVSGFGFELTCRLAMQEEEPPFWALHLLQNLARYVFQTGNVFEAGHYLDCNGPIALGQTTDIRALLFAAEPELREMDTSNGKVQFLQVVGITLDELLQIKKWNASGFLKILGEQVPFLITDLSRPSILRSKRVQLTVGQLAEGEGSNTEVIFVGEASYTLQKAGKVRVIFGAKGVMDLKEILLARLKFSRPFQVASSQACIVFSPGSAINWRKGTDGELEIRFPLQ